MKLVGSQKKGYKLVSSFEKPKKNAADGGNTPPDNGVSNTPPTNGDGENKTN